MSVCGAERCHLLSGTGNKKSPQTSVVCLRLFVYLCLLDTHTLGAHGDTRAPLLSAQRRKFALLTSYFPVDSELAAASS